MIDAHTSKTSIEQTKAAYVMLVEERGIYAMNAQIVTLLSRTHLFIMICLERPQMELALAR